MGENLVSLLARCGSGEEDAIAILVRRYQPWAIELAASIVGDRGRAEDVVQEAFLAALAGLPSLRTPEAFPGWFRQIVRTWACRELRKHDLPREAPCPHEDPCSSPGAAATLDSALRREQVRKALDALPRAEREVADLYYLQERQCRETALTLGVPVGTVKRRLHDARVRLRGIMLGYLEEAEDTTPPENRNGLRF